MEHGSYYVDLVNTLGKPVGQKRRQDIDKAHDIYHSTHTLLITPIGEIVLSRIPARTDLPNLYANQLGATVATIRRSGESATQATSRAISRELFIDEPELHHLDDAFCELKNGQKSYISAYYMIGNAPKTYSQTDSAGFVVISANELNRRLLKQPQDFSPSLIEFWRQYRHNLPI